MKVCVVISLVLVMGGMGHSQFEEGVYKDAVKFVSDCGPKALTLCLKEKALKFIEQLPNNIDIASGIRIKQTESERLSREYTPITLPIENQAREATLDKVLMERVVDYLRSHTLEVKLPMVMAAVENESENSVAEARKGGGSDFGGGFGGGSGGDKKGGGGGKGGKKGGMGTMMMLMYMKMAMLYAIGIKAIGALAFKALLVAKIALTLAGVIALKKLFDGKGGSSTYEVIAHPTHVDEHSHGGYHDRVFNADNLVYRGYRTGS